MTNRDQISNSLFTLRESVIELTNKETKEFSNNYDLIKLDIWKGNMIDHIHNLENIIADCINDLNDSGKQYIMTRINDLQELTQKYIGFADNFGEKE